MSKYLMVLTISRIRVQKGMRMHRVIQLETKYFTAHGGAVPEETLKEIRKFGKTL